MNNNSKPKTLREIKSTKVYQKYQEDIAWHANAKEWEARSFVVLEDSTKAMMKEGITPELITELEEEANKCIVKDAVKKVADKVVSVFPTSSREKEISKAKEKI